MAEEDLQGNLQNYKLQLQQKQLFKMVLHCPLCCDQPFEDQQSLFFHLRGLRNNLFCPICSERFSTLELLISHLSRTCSGPQSPSEAKKKCISNISSNEQGDFEDTAENQITKSDKANVDFPSHIPFGIHSKLLKSVSIKIKEKNSPDLNTKKPIEVDSLCDDVDPKNATITNGEPVLKDVDLNSSVIGTPKAQKLNHSQINLSPTAISNPISEEHSTSNTLDVCPKNTASNCLSQINNHKHIGPTGKSSEKVSNKSDKELKNKRKSDDSNFELKIHNVSVKDNLHKDKTQTTCINTSTNLITSPVKVASTSININAPSSIFSEEIGDKKHILKEHKQPKICPSVSTITRNGEVVEEQVVKKRGRGRPRKRKLEDDVKSTNTTLSTKTPNKTTKYLLNKNAKRSNTNLLDSKGNSGQFEMEIGQNDVPYVNSNANMDPLSSKNKASKVNQVSTVDVPDALNSAQASKRKDESEEVSEENQYLCSSCDLRFSSIYEHITQHHNGEEVIVDIPEDEIKQGLQEYKAEENKSTKTVYGNKNKQVSPLKDKDEGLTAVIEDRKSVTEDVKSIKAEPQTVISDRSTCLSDEDDVKVIEEYKIEKKKIAATPDKQTCIPGDSNHFEFVKQINSLKKSLSGGWLRTQGCKRNCYHFVTNNEKMIRLLNEFKGNKNVHPQFLTPMKELFENPKINIIAITNKTNTPVFTYQEVNLNRPIPMFVVVRKVSKPDIQLGNIASYVLSTPCSNDYNINDISADAKVIAVMNVILGKDQTLTIENLVFKNKPAIEHIIPVLEDVLDPAIPLLKGGKLLKWKCKKCMGITWKFPLNKDIHMCNGCLICHKPFATRIALQKHMFIHKKNTTNYCEKCHIAFATSKVLDNHLVDHENKSFCPLCKLFVPLSQKTVHEELHERMPANQFPCSVCHKVFASVEEVKAHEVKTCGQLVAKYSCTLCDKKFFSLTALSYHKMDHSSVTIRFPCRFCPKTFIKEKEMIPRKAGKRKPSNYLQKIWHERIHTQERPVLCSACPKRFRSLAHQQVHSSKAHSRSKHKDVPIHMCSFCDRMFQNAHKLEEHKTQYHLPHKPT